jgi:hypothetical protein
MFGDGSLTFRKFATREPLPLATIHDAVLEFLRGRTDVVLSGAHAVNAYVDESRMTTTGIEARGCPNGRCDATAWLATRSTRWLAEAGRARRIKGFNPRFEQARRFR